MKNLLLHFVLAFTVMMTNGQDRTIGLIQYDSTLTEGYYLFSVKANSNTYLVNKCGELVNFWTSDYPTGNMELLMENGNLLRAGNTGPFENPHIGAGGRGGVIEMRSWDNTLLWQYFISDSTQLAHHEIKLLPNGNILALAWEAKTTEQAIAAGRDPSKLVLAGLWPEKIVEVRPILPDSAEIVWEWFQWDHLIQDFDETKDNYGVVADHPELFDINFTFNSTADWVHANAIDYNPELDQIILSARNFNEFYIIDHSTTTEEAAGHTGGNRGKGGDILFRYGNPQVYGRGDTSDQVFYDQHHPNWIDAGLPNEGKILVFNNGYARPDGQYSEVFMITPSLEEDGSYVLGSDSTFQIDTMRLIYRGDPKESFYAPLLSGAYQLADSNFLISDGPGGAFFEINYEGEKLWHYIIPIGNDGPLTQGHVFGVISPGATLENFFFRATKYDADFPGFDGKTLNSLGFIELEPLESLCEDEIEPPLAVFESTQIEGMGIYPNPVERGHSVGILIGKGNLPAQVELMDISGKTSRVLSPANHGERMILQIPGNTLPGMYIVKWTDGVATYFGKLIVH